MASMFGTTSLFQNSSVVRAMARCSSVKSSGVKISSGVVLSNRKDPPRCFVGETVVAAMITSLVIQIFENSGRALPAAHAHGDHPILVVAARHLAENGSGELGPGAAQRMAQRDGPAIGI